MNKSQIKFDCIHFRGAIPCKPNKLRGKICECDEYVKPSKRILIIKLGAIGDVIRTTPLLVRFREMYPDCHITWLTDFPDILPAGHINGIHKFEFRSVYVVKNQQFDIAINLDKDSEACQLMNEVEAEEKYGFTMLDKHLDVCTPAAEHKLITGLFDQISQQNTRSYLEEIFEICHLDFNMEPYLLDVNEKLNDKWKMLRKKAGDKKIIGVNTGCGKRWLTRLWPEKYYIELIKLLKNDGLYPVLLGGPDEHEKNERLANETGAYYPGVYPLKEFIAITNQADLIFSLVTMSMHIAIALKKPLILLNNIFNSHEFELYSRGEIIEPSSGCDCYFGQQCKRERHCMLDISVDRVFKAIKTHLPKK